MDIWACSFDKKVKVMVCIQARPVLISSFCIMMRLGVFLLFPWWDASPSQGYPLALNSPAPIYTPGWREALWELRVLPKNTTQGPWPGLEPRPLYHESNSLTTSPLQLQQGVPFEAILSRFHYTCNASIIVGLSCLSSWSVTLFSQQSKIQSRYQIG